MAAAARSNGVGTEDSSSGLDGGSNSKQRRQAWTTEGKPRTEVAGGDGGGSPEWHRRMRKAMTAKGEPRTAVAGRDDSGRGAEDGGAARREQWRGTCRRRRSILSLSTLLSLSLPARGGSSHASPGMVAARHFLMPAAASTARTVVATGAP
uniref:OSJNBa0042N22.6 protein n=2 Tax=Oryza TaxID=4527 RepID=Q7XPD3_ORYSJ|nr:OSJNBa0042N22.6 [Oryza sativa Japonica Group]